MTHDEVNAWVVLFGGILNGNATGFFMMVIAITGLVIAVKRLWTRFEAQLDDCRLQHEQCLEDNQQLAQAIIALGKGHHHDATTRAEVVLERGAKEKAPS